NGRISTDGKALDITLKNKLDVEFSGLLRIYSDAPGHGDKTCQTHGDVVIGKADAGEPEIAEAVGNSGYLRVASKIFQGDPGVRPDRADLVRANREDCTSQIGVLCCKRRYDREC